MRGAAATPAMDLSGLTPLEWVVVGLCASAAVWVIVRSVKLTLHPGEEEPEHVKRVIFREEERTSRPPASVRPSPPPKSDDGPGPAGPSR